MLTEARRDPFDPVANDRHYVRECWRCGHALTHEDNHLMACPVCGDKHLVPFGTRFDSVAHIATI